MPPSKKKKTAVKYYTIVFEKYMDIVTEVDKTYHILSDKVKELVQEIDIEDWYDSSLPDFIEIFLLVDTYKEFLDDKINNPSEEEIQVTVKNNIKDVLFTKDQLQYMQDLYFSLEMKKEYLLFKYNFSCSLN
jgi:hypothetical protein